MGQARVRSEQAILGRLASEQRQLDALRSRPVLRDPSATIDIAAERLHDLAGRLGRAIGVRLDGEADTLTHTIARVRALSPQATLQRGYAILSTADGVTITSVTEVEPDETIVARLLDGEIAAAVIDVEPADQPSDENEEP